MPIRTIMIIDDEPVQLTYFMKEIDVANQKLKEIDPKDPSPHYVGIPHRTAFNAIAEVVDRRPDFLIVDRRLHNDGGPHCIEQHDGWIIASKIRNDPAHRDVLWPMPILILTAASDREEYSHRDRENGIFYQEKGKGADAMKDILSIVEGIAMNWPIMEP